MSRDICPTCGLPWPNFCPQDGTRLQGPWTCPNAVDPEPAATDDPPTREVRPAKVSAAQRDTERMDQSDLELDQTVLETPAIRAEAAHAWLQQRRQRKADKAPEEKPKIQPKKAQPAAEGPPTKKSPPKSGKRKRKTSAANRDPDDVQTMLDMEALPPSAPPKGSRRKSAKPARKQASKKLSGDKLDKIAAETKAEISQSKRSAAGVTRFDAEALPADLVAKAAAKQSKGKAKIKKAPSKAQGKAQSKAPSSGGGGAKRQQPKEFSETQWFMKGIEVDADLLELVEEEEYLRDDSISEDKRKKFTLRDED